MTNTATLKQLPGLTEVTKGSGRFVYFHIHSFLAYSLLQLQSSGSFGCAAMTVISFMWMFCM